MRVGPVPGFMHRPMIRPQRLASTMSGIRHISDRNVRQGLHPFQMQPHLDVLVVVAEAAAENVDSPRAALLFVDADAHLDRVVEVEIEIRGGDIAEPAFAEIGAVRGDAPGRQDAVLRAFELPPARRIEAALVAEGLPVTDYNVLKAYTAKLSRQTARP